MNGESGLALTNTHVTPLGRETAREDPDRHRCLVLNLGYARKHAHLVVVTSSAKPQDRCVCGGERLLARISAIGGAGPARQRQRGGAAVQKTNVK